MKLSQINENLIMQQIKGQLQSAGPYSARPFLHSNWLYNASSGHDMGARTAGLTMMPTGVPHNPRHRQYLGLENRPGTIRL